MKVIVTKEDALGSNFLDSANCALAKAIKRQTGDEEVQVNTRRAFINNKLYSINPSFGIMEFLSLVNGKREYFEVEVKGHIT